MLANKSNLTDQIRLGEDSLLQLKKARLAGTRITGPTSDDLAAFANTRGGVCVLGIEDKTRDAVGIPLEHLDRGETLIREACNDTINPPLPAIIQRLTLPAPDGSEVPVITIDVERSLFVHRSPGGYLMRIGSSKREMSPEFLARLFQQRS